MGACTALLAVMLYLSSHGAGPGLCCIRVGGEDAALVNYHHYEQCNERLSC